jgi:uncharacterized protein
MSVHLQTHAEGIILPVRAQAGSRRNGLRGCQAGLLRVAVTQAAEKDKANQAIMCVLADSLGLRRSQIELVAGQKSNEKKFLIRGISLPGLQTRLVSALTEA